MTFTSFHSQWAVPFNTPVDTNVYTAYLDYIETPMDFSTVRRKCEGGAYAGPDEFGADMRLVFGNARSYNKPGTDVFVMASTLEVRSEALAPGLVVVRWSGLCVGVRSAVGLMVWEPCRMLQRA